MDQYNLPETTVMFRKKRYKKPLNADEKCNFVLKDSREPLKRSGCT